MVTGVTRNFSIALEEVRRVIDGKPGHRVIGVSLILARGRPVLVADTAITEMPTAEDLAADRGRGGGRRAPRSATSRAWRCSPSPTSAIRRASARCACRRRCAFSTRSRVDFEYDGEMGADVALNKELMARLPVLPSHRHRQRADHAGFHSAAISTRMLQELGGATGDRPADRRPRKAGADRLARRASDSDIVNMATLASFNIGG